MIATASSERWITPGMAAKILRMSPGYVRYLTDTGRLPAVRGTLGIRLIEKAAVEELARKRRAEGREHEQRAKR